MGARDLATTPISEGRAVIDEGAAFFGRRSRISGGGRPLLPASPAPRKRGASEAPCFSGRAHFP